MQTKQLIYTSRPFGFDHTTLESILFIARHHNQRDGITGALVCREDIFLQLLEGPADAVTNAYARILKDSRHANVAMLWSGDIEQRLFPNWDMLHDPAHSWLWTPDEVWAGAVTSASAETIRAIFTRIAAEPKPPGAGAL